MVVKRNDMALAVDGKVDSVATVGDNPPTGSGVREPGAGSRPGQRIGGGGWSLPAWRGARLPAPVDQRTGADEWPEMDQTAGTGDDTWD